jgi:hypothetical protein
VTFKDGNTVTAFRQRFDAALREEEERQRAAKRRPDVVVEYEICRP